MPTTSKSSLLLFEGVTRYKRTHWPELRGFRLLAASRNSSKVISWTYNNGLERETVSQWVSA